MELRNQKLIQGSGLIPEEVVSVIYRLCILVFFISLNCLPTASYSSGGITPEQIYQANLQWHNVVGSWEKLPEDNPLAENPANLKEADFRSLITLRKDGTCRIFSETYPVGIDGVWSFNDHSIHVTLPNQVKMDMYVYGVKGDFMITRTPAKNGLDQLWSRVK